MRGEAKNPLPGHGSGQDGSRRTRAGQDFDLRGNKPGESMETTSSSTHNLQRDIGTAMDLGDTGESTSGGMSSRRGRYNTHRLGAAGREGSGGSYDRSDLRASVDDRDLAKKHQQTLLFKEALPPDPKGDDKPDSHVPDAINAAGPEKSNTTHGGVPENHSGTPGVVPENHSDTSGEAPDPADRIEAPDQIKAPAPRRKQADPSTEAGEYKSSFLEDVAGEDIPDAGGKGKPSSSGEVIWEGSVVRKRSVKPKEKTSKLQGDPGRITFGGKTGSKEKQPDRLRFDDNVTEGTQPGAKGGKRRDKQKQISRFAGEYSGEHDNHANIEKWGHVRNDGNTSHSHETAMRGFHTDNTHGPAIDAGSKYTPGLGESTINEPAAESGITVNAGKTPEAVLSATLSDSDAEEKIFQGSPLSESRETSIVSDSADKGHKLSDARISNIQLGKPSKLKFDEEPVPTDTESLHAQQKKIIARRGVSGNSESNGSPVSSRLNEKRVSALSGKDTSPDSGGHAPQGKGTNILGANKNTAEGADAGGNPPSGLQLVGKPTHLSFSQTSVLSQSSSGRGSVVQPPKSAAAASRSQAVADKKAAKAQSQAEHSAAKLEKAKGKLPKTHRLKLDKTMDTGSGTPKPKRKLRFEAEAKSQADHIKGGLPIRPVKLGANAAIAHGHKKIYMSERENVGMEAAHKGELVAEGGLRRAYRRYKTKAFRRVDKLERKTSRLSARAAYRKTVADNPRLQKSFTSRMIQKHKIKRQYAKAAKEAKRSGGFVRRAAGMAGRAARYLVNAAVKNPKVMLIIGLIVLLIIMLSSAFSACSNMAAGIGQVVAVTSYLAEEDDIDDAAIAYTEWETELEMRVLSIRSEFPGFDEYRVSGASIGHNPFELMAYLTAAHQNFKYPEIRAVLQELFNEQYQLTITPSIEIRHYLNDDGELVPYEWHVLTVNLAARSFTDVISSRMSEDQRRHHELLMTTKGNRQIVGSPFPFNWIPFISSHYGWRIHPIDGVPRFHNGVDIGLPGGTEILAAHSGVITFAGVSGGYGNFVIIEGDNGITTRYAHCDTILVSVGQEVEMGDVIATVGTTGASTGNHLHFEVIRGGRFLNPAFFARTGEVSHRPAFGPPGMPMDNALFSALIEEAERHLSVRYVWGGSTPAQGFDCSGFVSYVLRAAGVRDVGRLTAQGLYNISTPVSPSDVRPGDLVFFEGTFSSYRTVTHVGIYVGGGVMIHTGSNPAGVEYTSIRSGFWQRHFYAFGRV